MLNSWTNARQNPRWSPARWLRRPRPARPSEAGSRLASLALTGTLLIGGAAAAPVRLGIVEGRSMEPTLNPGQPFLFSRTAGAGEDLRRGEVVLVRLQGRTCVKRVFAVGGDHFWAARAPCDKHSGTLSLLPDGFRASVDHWRRRYPSFNFCRISVPRDRVYVIGDGIHSIDSRDLGPAPADAIIGRVILPVADTGAEPQRALAWVEPSITPPSRRRESRIARRARLARAARRTEARRRGGENRI